MKTGDLDRIHSLGFCVEMDWNICFSIEYVKDDESITILLCTYDEMHSSAKYEDVVEVCCDIFYEWYNEHKSKIKDLCADDLDYIILGSVTKRVRRILSLDRLV